jgi:hypothetical protein
MPLPKTFQFSATGLQDYTDCPRRFQLRYVLQVPWPAPDAEPVSEREHHARLARDFHRLVHQHLLGIPAETLSASVHDPDLDRWWRSYLTHVPVTFGNARVIPEIGLSAPLAGYRAVAKYDAVVVWDSSLSGAGEASATGEGANPKFVIVDWKTYRRRPSRTWLARRLQTRLYPLMLVQAGSSLTGGRPIQPDEVEMRYWLAEYPERPESFPYDTATYQADLAYLADLITEIAARGGSAVEHPQGKGYLPDTVWPLTTDLRRCRFCNYRSLCERGKAAGPVAEYLEGEDGEEGLATEESGPDSDAGWGQVQETAY